MAAQMAHGGSKTSLQWLPWPMTMLVVGVIALRAGGYRLAVFSIAALGTFLVAGYWPQSMNTLSLVLLAVPIPSVLDLLLASLLFS